MGRRGLVKGDKIINSLTELVGDRIIEELPMPFTAIAADVANEKEVWLNSGRLFDAIRASISLPLFFTPVAYKEGYLIDGGVLNPVPIAPTFSDTIDITIAVNLGGPLENTVAPEKVNSTETSGSLTLHDNVSRFIDHLKSTVNISDKNDWDAYDIANQAFDAMQSTISRQKLAAYPPDMVIEIARNACGTLEFDRADEMIELGRKKTEECLNQAVNIQSTI